MSASFPSVVSTSAAMPSASTADFRPCRPASVAAAAVAVRPWLRRGTKALAPIPGGAVALQQLLPLLIQGLLSSLDDHSGDADAESTPNRSRCGCCWFVAVLLLLAVGNLLAAAEDGGDVEQKASTLLVVLPAQRSTEAAAAFTIRLETTRCGDRGRLRRLMTLLREKLCCVGKGREGTMKVMR
ncbi:unnamed protein product, partial [Ectocarpus sp. 12 AP-2014]